jgi:LPS export ABC transporter protein LptC/lipopolysaccharide transport protein LptA
MRPQTTRLVRGGLLAVLAGLAVLVAWSVRQAPRPVAGTPAPVASAAPKGTRILGYERKTLKKDKTSFEIRASSFEGSEDSELHLLGVEMDFTFMKKGKPTASHIVADRCTYMPTIQKAVFQGHVKVTDADGFDLETEELIYRADKGIARSEKPVAFRRKDLSGTSTGIVYHSEEGRLEMPADVVVHVQDPDKPATEIKSARAEYSREEALMKFLGGVEITQGADRLKAQRYLVNLGEDETSIYRAQAVEDVEMWTAAGTPLPGLPAGSAGRGSRYLKCKKLDLWFRGDRTLQEAVAGPEADLTMMPGKGEPQEKRRLIARFLNFVFEEHGRLDELRASKDTVFTADPLPPSKEAPRRVTCQRFLARMEPATGEITFIEFDKDVEFVQAARKATGQKAYYDGPKATLFLKEDPVLLDTAEGSDLRAQAIDVGVRSGDMAARFNVRHILQRRKGARAGLLGAEGEPTQLSSRFFEYKAQGKVAHYKEQALLRAGKDEVRAAELRLHEGADGKRRLEAEGGVVSRMQPKEAPGGKAPAVVEGRARSMVYEEAANRIVYEGDVVIRQGDIQTKSPQATLTLNAAGTGIQTLLAGEPVEVQQGARRATGARGTYTPATETFVLVGEKVVLQDPTQQVEGRSLTFHVGDARVLVDGREEIRTEMIIRKDTPRP